MKKLNLLIIASAGLAAASTYGQIAEFTFDGGSLADSAGVANITVTDITTESSFNSFTDSSGWDSAAQVSGAASFFSAPTTQAAASDAVTFTITADSGYVFSITEFSFQARSTSQAPDDIGFMINGTSFDFSSTYDADTGIQTISESALTFLDLTSATISIQGWNSAGSSALQLDNLAVSGVVTVVPEPGTYALLAGFCGLGFVMLKRRR